MKEFFVSEKNTISLVYFYPLNSYLVPIFEFKFFVDLMTFCRLDLKVIDDSIDDKLDRNADMGKGKGKEDRVIIAICMQVLYYVYNYHYVGNYAAYYET